MNRYLVDEVVKYIAMYQFILLLIFIVFFICFKLFFQIRRHISQQHQRRINDLLQTLKQKKIGLPSPFIALCTKHIFECLTCLSQTKTPINVQNLQQLSDCVLKPKARQLVRSRHWSKQYLAVLCYEYGVTSEDETLLVKLVQNKMFLIRLGVARVIFKYPTPVAMQALIQRFAEERKLHQSLVLEIIPASSSINQKKILDCLFDELVTNPDDYVKCFCYRVASHLKPSRKLLPQIKKDMLSKNIELKLAAIYYLGYIPNKSNIKLLIHALDDSQFEVRAVAAKLLGDCQDDTCLLPLEKKLHDSVWWVRANAAQALAKLGPKGITILKKQTPTKDRFAYEIAQRVLIIINANV